MVRSAGQTRDLGVQRGRVPNDGVQIIDTKIQDTLFFSFFWRLTIRYQSTLREFGDPDFGRAESIMLTYRLAGNGN